MIAVRRRFLLASMALLLVVSASAAASDELARARDLYRSASYDEALVVLDEIAKDPAASPADRVEATEYRLFCLIALDRKGDARSAIEALVNTDPFYQLPTEQASPRVRTMFKEVRQALLPGIVQREYATAKAAFDRQDPASAVQFDRVLNLLSDPQLAPAPSFADLRTVASGFRDLSKALAEKAAAAAPAVTSVPQSAPPTTQPTTPAITTAAANTEAPAAAAPAPAARPAVTMYRDGDADVVAPVTLNQALPQLRIPAGVRARDWQWEGVLEVVIDENGDVVSAKLRQPFHPSYDPQIVKAAMAWKYEPARKAGVPVRFVKNVAVRLGAQN